MTNLTVGIFMKGWAHDILFEMGFRVGFTEVYGLDLSTASGLNHNPQPKMSVEKLKLQSKLKRSNHWKLRASCLYIFQMENW